MINNGDIAILNEIVRINQDQPALSNGQLNISEMELEYMLKIYAIYGAGFSPDRNKTVGLSRFDRKRTGERFWEDKSVIEQRQEFFEYLKKDLAESSKQIVHANKVDYLLNRALDPWDPMAGFYKVVLIKLGATITQDGAIKLSDELKRNLENKQIKDLINVNTQEYRHEFDSRHLKQNSVLKLSL